VSRQLLQVGEPAQRTGFSVPLWFKKNNQTIFISKENYKTIHLVLGMKTLIQTSPKKNCFDIAMLRQNNGCG
jgi:hypothetical protein